MKKTLLTTSALVGAATLFAVSAEAQEIKISGFQHFFASGGDADGDSSDRGFAFSTNTEVHLNGSIVADNGITFGFRVEFEADAGQTNNVDENSVWAAGSFGKIEFGNNDGVEDTFVVNGTSNGVEYGGIGNPTSNFLDRAFVGEARTSTEMRSGSIETSDATKITYTTPYFDGFQAGISYTPDTADGTDGNRFSAENSTGFHDHVGLGLGYDGEFNGVGVEIGLVGAFAKADAEPEDDAYGVNGGVALTYAGFTFATGAVWDDLQDNGGEGWGVDAGIGYGIGPWEFAINALYSEDDDSNDELLAGSANAGYNFAPGVTVFVTGYLGEEDLGAGGSNEIVAVTSGLRLAF